MLSLSLEGTTIRLVEAQGKRVMRWHSAIFNPALVRRGTITDPSAMAQVLSKALEAAGMRPGNVVAAMDGVGSMSRTIAVPTGAKPGEYIPREARRLFSQGPEEAFLFWQPVAGEGSRFFALSIPREPLLAFRQTMRLARLRLVRLDTRPLALARWANENQAIVVSVENSSVIIIVLADSFPVAMQTHWLGDLLQTPSAISSQVTAIISQTVSYYNDTHRESMLGRDVPLLLVGSGAGEDLANQISSEFGYKVNPASSIFAAPADFPLSQFCINLGLLMKLPGA